jgi:hypothetical protein
VLGLTRAGKLQPQLAATAQAALDDAPRVLTERIAGDETKTVLSS